MGEMRERGWRWSGEREVNRAQDTGENLGWGAGGIERGCIKCGSAICTVQPPADVCVGRGSSPKAPAAELLSESDPRRLSFTFTTSRARFLFRLEAVFQAAHTIQRRLWCREFLRYKQANRVAYRLVEPYSPLPSVQSSNPRSPSGFPDFPDELSPADATTQSQWREGVRAQGRRSRAAATRRDGLVVTRTSAHQTERCLPFSLRRPSRTLFSVRRAQDAHDSGV
jgi:hypothetical protein